MNDTELDITYPCVDGSLELATTNRNDSNMNDEHIDLVYQLEDGSVDFVTTKGIKHNIDLVKLQADMMSTMTKHGFCMSPIGLTFSLENNGITVNFDISAYRPLSYKSSP